MEHFSPQRPATGLLSSHLSTDFKKKEKKRRRVAIGWSVFYGLLQNMAFEITESSNSVLFTFDKAHKLLLLLHCIM